MAAQLEYGLIVQQPGRPQAILRSFIAPMLHFRYGLITLEATRFQEAAPAIREHSKSLRCAFLIQNEALRSDVGISGLNLMGKYPLFALVPESLVKRYEELCSKAKNAYVCSWEHAFNGGGPFLKEMVESAFKANGIGRPFESENGMSYTDLREDVEQRLGNLDALPSLPSVIRKILRMLSNPETTMDQLEAVLSTDPAMVQKIHEVVKSPVFAGSGQTGEITLKEAIVRLGLKEVGSIAMQVMVMNSFVEEAGSLFDFKRFWGHSVGTALAADKIYKSKIANFNSDISFQDYWVGGLLHDVGKLVIGMFFWEYFSRVMGETVLKGVSFREAERLIGDSCDHEQIGRLVLLKSDLGPEITEWVGSHDSPNGKPQPLHCLLHLANNLC